MTPEELKKKIAEIKAKHSPKGETFQGTIDRVKTKYGMMPDAPKPLKKDDETAAVMQDMGKAKMDQDMTPGTKRIARDERRAAPKDPLQAQVTAKPGVSKQGASLRANHPENAKEHAKTTMQALKKDDESEGYKALRARMKAPHKSKGGGSTDDKIKAAMDKHGRGHSGYDSNSGSFRGNRPEPKPATKPLSAREKFEQRVKAKGKPAKTVNEVVDDAKEIAAAKANPQALARHEANKRQGDEDTRSASAKLLGRVRQARKDKKAEYAKRKEAVYKKAFGDEAHDLHQAHEKLTDAKSAMPYDEQAKFKQRIPGTNAHVTYHGEDEKGRHHFESEAGAHGRHKFAAIKNAQGKFDIHHIPGGPSDHNVHGRQEGSWYHAKGKFQEQPMPWSDLDVAQAAKEAKRQLADYGSKGLKAAMTRVKQSGKFHELVGKEKTGSNGVHPKDYDKVNSHKEGWADDATHSLSVNQKAGGSNRFSYKFNPQHNAYVYHDYNESRHTPLPDKEVFENIIKPSPAYQSRHKDSPNPPGVMSHKELEAATPKHLKVMKSLQKSEKPKKMAKCMSFLKKSKKLKKTDMPAPPPAPDFAPAIPPTQISGTN